MSHTPRNKQRHISGPSLRADEPADDALPLPEGAVREDGPSLWVGENTDDVHSLLEENARLRRLLVQLSDIVRRNVVSAR
jgi:hypothetical protein